MALVAARLAGRHASGRRTFGWGRIEILAALFNGLLLLALSVVISVEAISRLGSPPAVRGAGVLAFGALGLLLNGVGALVLLRGGDGREDINLRGALLHTVADALGSAGVLVAGALVTLLGWNAADPAVAIVVAVLIAWSSWGLISEPIGILLERAPAHVDPDAIGRALCAVEGVREVHDLHVWTITTGFDALSVHVIVAPDVDHHAVLGRLRQEIGATSGITHTTIQVDTDHRAPLRIHPRGAPGAPRPRTGPLDRHDQR
jgi:cobalt-zinc-cadmium efflux system protein